MEQVVRQLSALSRAPVVDAAMQAALAEALDALAGGHPKREASLRDAAARVRKAPEAKQLALAAAGALRHVMAIVSESAPEEAKPARSRTEERRARQNAALEKKQARALDEAKKTNADPNASPLARPVETLSGVGPAVGKALRRRGLETVRDLVFLLPTRYDDDREMTPLSELVVGKRQVTVGVVASVRLGGRRLFEVSLEAAPDEAPGRIGVLRLVWFRAQGGMADRFPRGAKFRVAGTVDEYRGVLTMSHPETERLGPEPAQSRGIVARYPEVPGVPPTTLARIVRRALDAGLPHVGDALPPAIREKNELTPVRDALRALHLPDANLAPEDLDARRRGETPHHARLAFEEFFLLELALHEHRKIEATHRAEGLHATAGAVERATRALPFTLTGAQARAVASINEDLTRDAPMRRLLQGDVGSGKTAVALLAAAHAISAGAQVAIMAPTEILAEQHFRNLAPLVRSLGIRAALVLGAERAAHRKKTRKELEAGTLDLVVGTHALLNEAVRFKRLRLVVVDEQHRFGVAQRLRLVQKSDDGGPSSFPHLLVMTATPIPRSLALVLYGDLEATVVDEMPPGRLPVVTKAFPLTARERALDVVARALAKNGQAYIVCPTIEQGEEDDVQSAERVYEELKPRFAAEGVALLHGRLPPAEKDAAMERFIEGEARVLVTTTVIEVGVDVPRANVILIERAERFGLAQLHQLRGRVGRAGQPSACLLVHEARSEDATRRIQVLCESTDGFYIAEQDLQIRGPGELFGRKQSGLPGFRYGDLRRDAPLLSRARDAAREVLQADPHLSAPAHAHLRRAVADWQASERAVVTEEAG